VPAFDTPKPILASIRLEAGVVRITAEDRTDTVVEVRPSAANNSADVKTAKETRVTYENGELVVKSPKARNPFGRPGSVTVEIALPQSSRISGSADLGQLLCEGELGDCDFKTGAGKIRVEQAGAVRLHTQHGDVTLERASAAAEVGTGSGEIRIGQLQGDAEIKNSNGSTWIDEVVGDLRVKAGNGNVTVGRAHAGVTSKGANGSIHLEAVSRGRVDLQTKAGDVEIGIAGDTAVWLDVKSATGTVLSSLDAAEGPGESAESVQVYARTGLGDIVIHRVQS
jgi:hypothetical protein